MSTASDPTALAPGQLVTFEIADGDPRQGRVLDTEWAATYGNPRTRIKVRLGETTRWITDEELVS